MEIKVKGIARYPHLVTPSRAKDVESPLKYSVQVLVHKNDPQCAEITNLVNQVVQGGFPNGTPTTFHNCWIDLAITEPENEALRDYMALKTGQKADKQKPQVVDGQLKPIMNPNLDGELTGQVVWINSGVSTFNKGSNGVNAYLNAVLLTGEKGDIPLEAISSKPSIEDMFSEVVSTNNVPVPNVTPAPPVPPLSPNGSNYQMTEKAAGATRDSFIDVGWTDEMLIKEGYMLSPNGVKPSFM